MTLPKSQQTDPEKNGTHALAKRWHHPELFESGWVGVPSAFLQHYGHLKPYPLTTGEALFVLHVMDFKWTEDHPFPGYKKLAQRMGISDKMARRHAQSLETKGLLKRVMRIGQTNRFDFTPLFDALKTAFELQKQQRRSKRAMTKGRFVIRLPYGSRKSFPRKKLPKA